MRFNNVDMEKIKRAVEDMRSNPSSAVRVTEVDGRWNLVGVEYQFTARCRTESGEFRLEVDSPGFMGGSGSRPGPMHYCLIGLTSCFMATLVSVASEKGVKLNSADVKGKCEIDFSKPFGLSNNPIIRSVRFEVKLDAAAPREVLNHLISEAKERCPAVYSLRTPIEPDITLV
ncbi:MAG: OsmC family protein [Aigarchaeota archaeon]|nr:OsmC family protein [Aigarchaeota archaeon]MDW8093206.1 OsmC family protein [Nitrososphaerota archaeon]